MAFSFVYWYTFCMLTDQDIQKLVSILATKSDIQEIKEDVSGLRESIQGLVVAMDGLAN